MDVIVNGKRCIDYGGKMYGPGQTIPGMKDKEAERLIGKGHAVAAAMDDGVIAKTGPIDKMNVTELKKLLDDIKVNYPADAKKADLVQLVMDNTVELPEA